MVKEEKELDLKTFLNLVCPLEAPDDRLEVRAIHPALPVQQFFWTHEELREEPLRELEAKGYNLYFGVAPRRLINGNYSGTKKGCLVPTCLFMDFDHVRDHNAFWLDFYQTRSARGIPAPSLFVKSGGGIHLYWFLDERPNRARWVSMEEKLVSLFPKADQVVKNLDRIMRLPTFTNPRHNVVATASANEVLYHDSHSFPLLTTKDRIRRADGRTKFMKKDTYGRGERDDFLFAYALRLIRKNLQADEVAVLMDHANDHRCIPPCPTTDVREKTRNALKFHKSGKSGSDE